MKTREPLAHLTVRMRGRLHWKLVESAAKHGHSINAEITRLLLESFAAEDKRHDPTP